MSSSKKTIWNLPKICSKTVTYKVFSSINGKRSAVCGVFVNISLSKVGKIEKLTVSVNGKQRTVKKELFSAVKFSDSHSLFVASFDHSLFGEDKGMQQVLTSNEAELEGVTTIRYKSKIAPGQFDVGKFACNVKESGGTTWFDMEVGFQFSEGKIAKPLFYLYVKGDKKDLSDNVTMDEYQVLSWNCAPPFFQKKGVPFYAYFKMSISGNTMAGYCTQEKEPKIGDCVFCTYSP